MSFFQAIHKEVVFFHLLRMFLSALFFFILINTSLERKTIIKILVYSALFQVIIALFQIGLQHSIGLTILGEHLLSVDIDGVAKIEDSAGKILRAYGTFTHPNILGGFLVFIIILTSFLQEEGKQMKFVRWFLFLGIIATFSKSAILALFVSFLIYKLFLKNLRQKAKQLLKKVAGVMLIMSVGYAIFVSIFEQFFMSDSWVDRILYVKTSLRMIIDHPFGVGVGHNSLYLPQYADISLEPWKIQPVHNVMLLIGSELGVIAMGFLCIIIGIILYRLWEKAQYRESKIVILLWIAWIILAQCDHYFYTLPTGHMMTIILLWLTNEILQKPTVKAILQKKKQTLYK